MENMIAIENVCIFNRQVTNHLVTEQVAKNMNPISWTSFDRLTKKDVSEKIKTCRLKDRYVGVTFFEKDNDTNKYECYERYVSVDRAIELIEDTNLFIFKFNMLSESVSQEYKMYSF